MLWLRACALCVLAPLILGDPPCREGPRTKLVRRVQESHTRAAPKDGDDRHCPQDDIEEEYVDVHDPSCAGLGAFVQKIDYGPLSHHADLHVLPSSSACLRCGLCLAVAEQLNYTLTETLKNNTPKTEYSYLFDLLHEETQHDVDLDPKVVVESLQQDCDSGFLNYGLREYKGERYVTEALPFTDHVPAALDGTWTETLQWLCKVYLSEYGELRLYRDWVKTRDLTDQLCRSNGIFRDCVNVDIDGYLSTSNFFRCIRKPKCL